MTPDEKLARAAAAKRLLEDSTLVAAFDAVMQDAIAALCGEPSSDKWAGYWHEQAAVERVRRKLRMYITDGKITKIEETKR